MCGCVEDRCIYVKNDRKQQYAKKCYCVEKLSRKKDY